MRNYRVGTLIANVQNVFPVITELETAQDNEWYVELKKYFDEFLDLNFADRVINRLVERNDFASLLLWVQKKIRLNVLTNIYKYSRLYETTILEYNPLWNVDGVEERTVNRSKSGNDTDTYNENNTITKTGTDTTAKTGTDTTAITGSDTTAKTGTDTTAKTGTDTTAITGSDTTTIQKTTFDSSTFYDTDKNTLSHDTTDTTTHNTTDTITYNTTDTTTHNTTDTITYDTTDTTTYNTTDTDRHTGTKGNVFENEEEETETIERHGNIGVTKSTELIDSQRITVNYSYIENVVHDIVNTFTYLVD